MAEGTSLYLTWYLFLRFIPFRFTMEKQQSIMGFFFLPSKLLDSQMVYASFFHSSNPSSTIFNCKRGEQRLILILLFNSKLIAVCVLREVRDFCLTVRKNHITADIRETVRIILTLVIHSYSNTNIKLKREKINQHSAHLWHLKKYIKIILSWGLNPAPQVMWLFASRVVKSS